MTNLIFTRSYADFSVLSCLVNLSVADPDRERRSIRMRQRNRKKAQNQHMKASIRKGSSRKEDSARDRK